MTSKLKNKDIIFNRKRIPSHICVPNMKPWMKVNLSLCCRYYWICNTIRIQYSRQSVKVECTTGFAIWMIISSMNFRVEFDKTMFNLIITIVRFDCNIVMATFFDQSIIEYDYKNRVISKIILSRHARRCNL